jgi:hypothetical protein
MQILAPYVLSEPSIDKWQIWLNTTDQSDLAWLTGMREHSKVRLIEPPLQRPGTHGSINQFYRFCCDAAC